MFFRKNTEKKTTESVPTAKKTTVKKTKAEDGIVRKKRQFVSPHPDGGWQVKIEGGKKATKRFDTKAEAEEYAKRLAKNQETSMMRQKKNGKLQKK